MESLITLLIPALVAVILVRLLLLPLRGILKIAIHSGCGSRAYTFIWGMVGENQAFDDMDPVAMKDLM